jgi:hypothetical protein
MTRSATSGQNSRFNFNHSIPQPRPQELQHPLLADDFQIGKWLFFRKSKEAATMIS